MAYITTTADHGRPRRARSHPPFGISRKVWPFLKAVVAAAVSALSFYVASDLLLEWQPESWGVADRLALVVKSCVFAILPAVVAIIVVAIQRLDPDFFVGMTVKPSSALDINSRFIKNTFEQFLLFSIGISGLSLYAPASDATVIPVLTAMFLIGRMFFWFGYHKNTHLRAYGFGLTFYPTVVVFAWLVVRMTTGYAIPI